MLWLIGDHLLILFLYLIIGIIGKNINSQMIEKNITLKHVIVLFRHGHRLPLIEEIYPKDIYKFDNEIEKFGYGTLTNLGKRQEYKLGQELRKRYNLLLTDYYKSKWIYAQTTDFERTHMSGQSMLTGLYPPRGEQIWSSFINHWQPIPLRSFPEDNDNLLMATPCQRYIQLFNDRMNNEIAKNFTEQYNNVFKKLEKYTGNKMDLINATNLSLMFEIEEGFNLKLPKWSKEFYPKPLKEIVAISYAMEVRTKAMKKLRSGNLINYILQILHMKATNKNERRFTILSAHDNTIVTLYRSLGFQDYIKPEYASSIIIELHKIQNNQWTIEMFLDESGTTNWKNLNIPECAKTCNLEQFTKLYINLYDSKWNENCKI